MIVTCNGNNNDNDNGNRTNIIPEQENGRREQLTRQPC